MKKVETMGKEKQNEKRGGKEKKRQSRVQEDEQTCYVSFPWQELLKYLVQYPLICTTSSWEIWFDWFQPEPTVLGAAGTLPTGRYIRYPPIHDKSVTRI